MAFALFWKSQHLGSWPGLRIARTSKVSASGKRRSLKIPKSLGVTGKSWPWTLSDSPW